MKDPAFLFYPNDYLGGTLGMTFGEKGCYFEVLMLQFNRGHMTKHMIGQILGQSMDKVWSSLESKFKIDENGLYYNERLEIEQNKRKAYSESRKNNKEGKNQYSKKDKKNGHMTLHMENENRNENKDIIKDEKIEFSNFWDKYNKKVGDKNKCQKKWDKLTFDIQQKIINLLPEFISQFTDKQFQPFPETYLNQERWNDEIIKKTNGSNGQSNPELKTKFSDIPNTYSNLPRYK